MFRRLFTCLFLILFAAGCTDRYADYFPYHDDGTKKPHIVFLPMLDSSSFCEDDSLSKELTLSACREIMYNGDLYLIPENTVSKMMSSCGPETDYFGKDLSFANQFGDADFIVITEIFEHEVLPRDQIKNACKRPCGPTTSFASMKIRIRVIDCRGKNPRVALQEILETHQPVSNNTACRPMTEPNGFKEAHKRLTDQLVLRLENVIWSCR